MSKRDVLIVDDSPVSRKILRSCLPAGREFVVREAADGRAGLERYREQRPEITFLDLTMPGMTGLEFLAAVKGLQPEAVVVVVTADVQAGSIRKALELGAVEVLHKPPTREAVSQVVDRAEAALRGAHGS